MRNWPIPARRVNRAKAASGLTVDPAGMGAGMATVARVATVAIFVPGLLLAIAGSTLWRALARYPRAGGALAGVNAVVVGLLAAALADPVWVSAVDGPIDAAIAVAGLLMLQRWNVAPLAVLAWCVGASMAATWVA